jgi:hypothetical protein
MSFLTPRSVFAAGRKPPKAEVIQLLEAIMEGNTYSVVKSTRALLLAVTPSVSAGLSPLGYVLDDPTEAYNGIYEWTGATWVRRRGFPDSFAKLTQTGGTNAVVATTSAGVDPAVVEVLFIEPTATNTDDVTLTVDGAAAKPVRNVNGDELAAGEWTAGRKIMLVEDATEYRLLSDPDVDGLAAAAAASAASAEEDRILAEQAAIDAQAAVTFSRVVVRGTTTGAGPYDMGVGNTIGTPNNLDVKLGGVIQDHNTYTVAGTEFTFTVNPGAGLAYEAVLTSETRVLNAPSAGSVTEEALDPVLLARFDRIITAQDYGAVFDDSVGDRAKIKEAAMAAVEAGVPFVVPNTGLERTTGLVLQVPEDFPTIMDAYNATLNWIFPGARPLTAADRLVPPDYPQNHVPQVCVTISASAGVHLYSGDNITVNHPSGNLIRVAGRDRVALTLASQQSLTYSSGVHFLKLRFSDWPSVDPVVDRYMRIINPAGSGEAQSFDGGWRITAVDPVNKDITLAVYAKTDTATLTAIVSSGTFIYLPTLIQATHQPYSGADVGLFDVHTTLRLQDVGVSGNSGGTNASTTCGIIVREGAELLLEQYVVVSEFQRSGLWLLNDAYAQVGYAAFCGNDGPGINNLQSVVDGTNISTQGNGSYGYIAGIGSSGSIVLSAFGGCGNAGIFVANGGSIICSGHSRRSQYGIDCKAQGHANINDMECRSNTVFDVRRRGGGQIILTANDSGTFDPPLDTGDDYGGFTALEATLEAVT